ncbi:hypothetical protein Cni_G23343 [Canna indica]|uniref:Embryonic flower 1 n=1 Tax=Canna indica TaxID=4628 RepID=A0AAQ3QM59_9LILI|nr:hypothetical protein Cni_G23343 [Canna indica]
MEVALKEHLKEKESVPLTDGTEDSDVCNHFTIRGYVSGVRKRDAKICWPLFIPYSESSDILTNVLPPLHVSKFKRWSCLDCLQTINTAADTGNVGSTDVENEQTKTKNSSFFLNGNVKRLFSGSKQFSENIMHGAKLVSDSSININHGDCIHDSCHGKKENGSITEDTSRKGMPVCICGIFRSGGNQGQPCKPTSAMAEDEFQTGKNETREMTVNKNNSETAFYNDASPMVCAKPNECASIGASDDVLTSRGNNLAAYQRKDDEKTIAKSKMKVMADGMVKETKMMIGVDLDASKNDARPTIPTNIINYDLLGSEQSHDEASYCTMDLLNITNCSQDNNSNSHGKVHHKKVRKLRFLEDIMKSEDLHISKKVHTLKGDAKTSHIKNKYDGGSDGSKCDSQLGDCKSIHVCQNSKVTHINLNDGLEANQNKDEELSLMHWLKKVSKKFVTDDSRKRKAVVAKEFSKIKDVKEKIGVSLGIDSENDIDPLLQHSKVGKHETKHTVEKENKVPQVKPRVGCLMPHQENCISTDTMMKHVHPGNLFPKLRSLSSASILPPVLGNVDRSSHKKGRRKKKASQVEDKNSSQINFSKKEIRKKRRTAKTHEKETIDDIPMDIVELLAKNQHERNLMNADASKFKHELSMMHREIKPGNDTHVSGYFGGKVSNARSMEYRKHIHIDLNQQATDLMTIPQCDGQQPCTTDLPLVDSRKIYPLQNSPWDIMMLQDLGSSQKYQGVSASSSSGGTHHVLQSQLKGKKFGVNTRNIDTYCNYAKVIPYDTFLDRSQRIVIQDAESAEPMNVTNYYRGEKSEQPANRTTLPARSYLMEGRSRFHPGGTVPIDLHTNETVSAMHLLRLVDQAALSGASWDINCIGSAQDAITNQPTMMLGAEVGLKIRETAEGSFAAIYSTHDPNEGKITKPHRPVPRIGALGSLLQKEIMTHSSIGPLGSKDSCSNEFASFCLDPMEKTDISSSAINNEYGESCLSATIGSKKIEAGESVVHKFKTGQVEISKKDEQVRSVRHDFDMVNCIINRNPADFSLPDDDNIYMRGSEDQSLKCVFPHGGSWYQTHHDGKKWQVVKLPVLKGP